MTFLDAFLIRTAGSIGYAIPTSFLLWMVMKLFINASNKLGKNYVVGSLKLFMHCFIIMFIFSMLFGEYGRRIGLETSFSIFLGSLMLIIPSGILDNANKLNKEQRNPKFINQQRTNSVD